MVKNIFAIFFFFTICSFQGQNNLQWQGYFSYNLVRDIAESPNNLFVASENALFVKNLNTNELKTLNTVDGLKSDEISSVFRASNGQLFVGNTNGLLLVINTNNSINTKNGIVEEIPVSPFIKKINHFLEFDSKLYISCDYGISVFDLTTQEFGDSYFIGANGSSLKVKQTAILNGEIFAVTENQGIKRANITSPNLVDFNQWIPFDSGFWSTIDAFNNQLVAANANGRLYRFAGNNPIEFANNVGITLDGRVFGDYAIFCNATAVRIYNTAFQQVAFIQNNQITDFSATFTCASVINGIVYIGTQENGIVSAPLANPNNFTTIMPDGPILNSIFRVRKSTLALYAIYGGYDRTYNPYNPSPGQFPINKFTTSEGWTLFPYEDLLGAKALSNIVFKPNRPKDFFVASYFSGLLKVENEIPTQLFDKTNTGNDGIESLVDPGQPNVITNDQRINGPAYDRDGNLWMTNSFLNKGLKVLRTNNQWQSYNLSSIIPETLIESYGLLVVDKNNTKWLPTQRNGLVGFNETLNKSILIQNDVDGNLPSLDIRCLAIDNRNQLWVGTGLGLRIISSVDQFISETELKSRAIIIEENGLAQELFFQQFILDIAVDGANRKWVSTAEGGVFLVSPNGQETIYKFTKDNSPLPSNTINDIEIDSVTGEVFFASDKGLVSFKGTATAPSDSLANVYAYPNPVRPNFSGTVKIANLTTKAVIKITDIEGNLVYETTSEGGTLEWDTTAFGKYKVASGVYLILISSQDGTDTTVKKLMIIR
jgi:ligand-binding sensor domain-containing protein